MLDWTCLEAAIVTVRWEAVDRLIENLDPNLLSEHGLGPFAARRLRLRGQPLPDQLIREDRAAATANLVAPSLLARIREAYDGPLLLLKGPEVAARYPDRARRFGDLDLLAGDADAAHAALQAAGFRLEVREWPPPGYDDIHRPHYHLHPLEWAGFALKIEIHRHVKWPEGLKPPSNADFFDAAVPSSVGVAGLLAPHPNYHAVLLASHAWGEIPMRKLRELVDVLVFVDDSQRDELRRLARSWEFDRAWDATLGVADWLLGGAPEPRFVRIWARYLRHLREPTVAEMHLQQWLSPFWLVPPATALRRAGAAFVQDLRPWPRQTWADKGRQALRALLHPLSPKSEHDRRSGVGRSKPQKAYPPEAQDD